MKLHIYEHCPFCVRGQMIFGLKNIPFEKVIIMEGDAETPTRMVGRKMVPILEKDDGSFMGESMDIVKYVDGLSGERITDAPVDPQIEAWTKAATGPLFKLAIPRFTQGEFPELATPDARAAYLAREEKAFGSMKTLMASTPELLDEMNQKLRELEPLVADREQIDTSDFILFPLLRSLSIVKGIEFGPSVTGYTVNMAVQSKVSLLSDQAR
ncbi:glutaredoxin 2 [Siccibacter colletis]|uniref:glutaredoxin 2 n=1 Tax=Siccibacter colletis TaxID=1505757 RepID=UPI0004E13657|nr:glutaredoxin 2 [Siccibacter colletis]